MSRSILNRILFVASLTALPCWAAATPLPIQFSIVGMHCEKCARGLTEKLHSLCHTATVDFATTTGSCTAKDPAVTMEAIRQVIEKNTKFKVTFTPPQR